MGDVLHVCDVCVLWYCFVFLEDHENYRTVKEIFVPEDTGIQYAKLSGDWNPIHLIKITAWPMGFKAPIAHGMWTLPRAMAISGVFGKWQTSS